MKITIIFIILAVVCESSANGRGMAGPSYTHTPSSCKKDRQSCEKNLDCCVDYYCKDVDSGHGHCHFEQAGKCKPDLASGCSSDDDCCSKKCETISIPDSYRTQTQCALKPRLVCKPDLSEKCAKDEECCSKICERIYDPFSYSTKTRCKPKSVDVEPEVVEGPTTKKQEEPTTEKVVTLRERFELQEEPADKECKIDLERCEEDNECCSGLCKKGSSGYSYFGRCQKMECNPVSSEKLVIICLEPSKNITSCDQALRHNSKALFRCDTPRYWSVKDPEYTEIICKNGEWNRPLIDDFCEKDCGTPAYKTAHPVIRNGHTTEIGKFPWHAAIYEFIPEVNQYEQQCGGTLISPKVVVSAAHCFTRENTRKRKVELKIVSLIKVAVGKVYRNISASDDTKAQIKDIARVDIPPEYNSYWSLYAGDIAFVVLKDKVDYSWAVQPICIDIDETSSGKHQLVEGARGKVAGWGFTEHHTSSDQLLHTEMPVVSEDECREKIDASSVTYLTKDKLCLGAENPLSNICNGDSGGGLVFPEGNKEKYYLRGIVSLGPKCDLGDGFALFTNLASYGKLLEEYLRMQ